MLILFFIIAAETKSLMFAFYSLELKSLEKPICPNIFFLYQCQPEVMLISCFLTLASLINP